MFISGNEDLRVQKTITAIRQTFIDLLTDMDYEKITVKALCERAKINKKTFYRYYETLDALLIELLEEFSNGYMEKIKNYRVPEDLEQINREFFLYSSKQSSVYEKIVCSVSHHHFGNKMISKIVECTWKNSSMFQDLKKYEQKILLTFACNVGLELYRQWVNEGKNIALEEIIKLSSELLCRGTSGYSSLLKNEQKNKLKNTQTTAL